MQPKRFTRNVKPRVIAIAHTAKNPSRRFAIAFAILFAVLATLFLASRSVVAADRESLKVAKALSEAYADVVEMAGPAVVGIETEKLSGGRNRSGDDEEGEIFDNDIFERFFRHLPREFGPGPRLKRAPERRVRGIGSGIIIDRTGHILTNNHVIAEADKIRVELAEKGRIFEAEIVGRDPNTDLAVIKLIDAPSDLPIAKIGDSDALRPGNIVVAIGSPMGFKQSVTTGVVSAKGRTLGELSYERFIQTDAAINPGNSGGPLVNLDGEVVGLNTLISTRSGGSDGIGFAIPINQAKSVIAQLIEKGSVTRGWLGIVMNPEDPEISVELGHDGSGVLVTDVDPEGPAAKAGIRKGDLIVSFDNMPINDNDHLRYLVADTTPGRDVPIVVVRASEKVNLSIYIEPQPDDLFTRARGGNGGGSGPDSGSSTEMSSDKLGIDVQNLDSALRQRFEIGDDIKTGVLVTNVNPTGPAADKGITPGTVIIEINNRPVNDVATFKKILDENSEREKILVYVKRGQVSRYIMLNFK